MPSTYKKPRTWDIKKISNLLDRSPHISLVFIYRLSKSSINHFKKYILKVEFFFNYYIHISYVFHKDPLGIPKVLKKENIEENREEKLKEIKL